MRFGDAKWPLLRRRLATIRAAVTIQDLRNAPGRTHPLTGNRRGQFAMYLWGTVRLVFEPIEAARTASGASAAVRIIEIVDYHAN